MNALFPFAQVVPSDKQRLSRELRDLSKHLGSKHPPVAATQVGHKPHSPKSEVRSPKSRLLELPKGALPLHPKTPKEPEPGAVAIQIPCPPAAPDAAKPAVLMEDGTHYSAFAQHRVERGLGPSVRQILASIKVFALCFGGGGGSGIF